MGARVNSSVAKVWGKLAVAALMGTVLVSCGAARDDSLTRSAGEALSSASDSAVGKPSNAPDGRMLKPEGYEGLWFETEPADPWEHYVWLSQKYVGDPVLLGQLEPGDAAEAFVGEPDICSDSVVQRMGELGFKNVEGIDDSSVRSCDFRVKPSAKDIFGAVLALNEFSTGVENHWSKLDLDFGPQSRNLLWRSRDSETDLACVALGRVDGSTKGFAVTNNMSTQSEGFEDACRRSYLTFWIFRNIGLLEGTND